MLSPGTCAFAAVMRATYTHTSETEEDCPAWTANFFISPWVCGPGTAWRVDPMKRIATWAFYAVGALAIGYLALYAYAVFNGRDLQPGEPIRIFRKQGAPSYS